MDAEQSLQDLRMLRSPPRKATTHSMRNAARAPDRTFPSNGFPLRRPHWSGYPYLLRDSNFLLPRSGFNSFDTKRVRVSFCMSRFGEPRNPRWRPLDGQRYYRLVIDEIGQKTCRLRSGALATKVVFTHPGDSGTLPCRLPRTAYLGSLNSYWWEGLFWPTIVCWP